MVRQGKVTVVGAGAQGAAVAQRLAESGRAGTVVVTDAVHGRAEGLALDLGHCRPLTGGGARVLGTTTGPDGSGYEETAGSQLVVFAAGVPPRPETCRAEHLERNAEMVRQVVPPAVEASPEAVLLMLTSPVAELARVAQWESGFVHGRVLGQTSALDSARLAAFVAAELEVDPRRVRALALGWYGEDLVPVVSRCTVDDRPLTDLLGANDIEDLAERTRYAGAEVISLTGSGAGLRAPAAAAARVAEAVLADSREVLPVCAHVDGEFGIEDVWLGVEAEVGARGVHRVVDTPLTAEERCALRAAGEAARPSQRLAVAGLARSADLAAAS